MTDYRLYHVTRDGRIRTGEWIQAENPEQAKRIGIERCQRVAGEHCEIWCGQQLIAEIDCGALDKAESSD